MLNKDGAKISTFHTKIKPVKKGMLIIAKIRNHGLCVRRKIDK